MKSIMLITSTRSRPTNDPYFNAYNSGQRKHPNFSYRPNPHPSNVPQMNARQPLVLQRPPFPQQASPKSNLEAMMESMLLAQQKQDEYIKQLTSKVDVLSTHNKMSEA